MEKPSLTIKIIAGTVILICLTLAILLLSAMCSIKGSGLGAGIEAAALFFLFAICIGPIAIIGGPMFTNWCGGKMARQVFWPGNQNFREAPPEFAELRAKIIKGNVDEAMDELKAMLLENPRDRYVLGLMSDILIDINKDYQNAIGLLAGYLKAPERSDDDIQFVMKLVDIYLDHNADKRAEALLESELTKPYSRITIEKLEKRLHGIKG